MSEISSAARKHLRGLAHHRDPVIAVGKKGVTDELIQEVSRALDAHELIKVRFVDLKDERKELALAIAEKSSSALVAEIGNTAVFYLQHPQEKQRQIQLP